MMECPLTKIYDIIYNDMPCFYCGTKLLVKHGAYGYNQLWETEHFICEKCNNFVASVRIEWAEEPYTFAFSCEDLLVCIYPKSSKTFIGNRASIISSDEDFDTLEDYEDEAQLDFIPELDFSDLQKMHLRLKSCITFS